MSRNRWLEELKRHLDEGDRRQEGTREVALTDTPAGERAEGAKAPVVDIGTARADLANSPDERRLLAAGWSPKERCGPLGLTIWANPETGFYCSRKAALHRLANPLPVSPYRRLLKALGRSGRVP